MGSGRRDCMEICKVRAEVGLPCSNCKYQGKYCDKLKAEFKGEKPKDITRVYKGVYNND